MAEKTTSYTLRIDSNAGPVGREGAEALTKLQSSITSSQAAIKDYSNTLRSLRGSSDEVKKAKDELKAKIDAEKQAMSANNIALLRAGTSYTKIAEASKKASEEAAKQKEKQEAVDKSVRAAGGPVGELKEKLEGLKATFTTGSGAAALFVAATVAIAAAAIEATKKVLELGVELGRWIVEAADAARSASLLREAWTGSAENAAHLGNQIAALAGKVPLARDKLQEMSGEIVKALNNSRVSGQGIIDTFNAVAEASAAMGDTVGAKLREIVERAKNTGRVQIGLFELQGTGVSRDDIAKKLAERMKVSVDAARLALAQGRVGVNDAAAAIRDVVEARFGEINAKKLLSIDAQLQRFKDNLKALAKDVNIEPLLKGFAELGKLFDTSTVSGSALKTIVTTIGNAIGGGFGGQTTALKHVFEYGEIAAIKFLIVLKRTDLQLQTAFGKDYKSKILGWGLGNAESQMRGLADIIERTGIEIQKTITMIRDLGDKAGEVSDAVKTAWSGFEDLGGKVIDGLIAGIRQGFDRVKAATRDLATEVKDAFKNALGIHSPSLVFEGYGKQTTAGYQKGIERSSKGPQRAVDRMAPDAPKADGAAPGRGRAAAPKAATAPIEVKVYISAGDKGAKELSEPHFLQQLTKALGDALSNAGLPVQNEPTS